MKTSIIMAAMSLFMALANITYGYNSNDSNKILPECCKNQEACCSKDAACCSVKISDRSGDCCEEQDACCTSKAACCEINNENGNYKAQFHSKTNNKHSGACGPHKLSCCE